jgi:hypothetical protein
MSCLRGGTEYKHEKLIPSRDKDSTTGTPEYETKGPTTA